MSLIFCRDVNMCVSLYEGLAFAFHNKLESYGSEVEVVLVTNIYPKVVGGEETEYLWSFLHLVKTSNALFVIDCVYK